MLQSGSETLRFLTPTGDGGGGANAIFHSGAADRYEKIPIRRRGRVPGPLVQGGQRYQYLTLTAPGTAEIDGAERDRAPWTGDQFVAAPTAFHSVPLKYVRDTLTLLGSRPGTTVGPLAPAQGEVSQPGPMPAVREPHSQDAVCCMYTDTYSMMYVLAVRNYLLYSGDTAFARQAWPLVTRQTAWNQRYVGSDGLYSVEPPGDMNWNLETKPGVQTYVNGVYRETLLAAADIGEAIGEKNRVTRWRRVADQIKTEVNRRFFNKATGVYDPNADERGAVLQDANVQAVLSGIATGDQAERVLARLADTLDTAVGRRSVSGPAPPATSAGTRRSWARSTCRPSSSRATPNAPCAPCATSGVTWSTPTRRGVLGASRRPRRVHHQRQRRTRLVHRTDRLPVQVRPRRRPHHQTASPPGASGHNLPTCSGPKEKSPPPTARPRPPGSGTPASTTGSS